MMKLTLLAVVVLCLSQVNGEGQCMRNGVRCLEYTVQKSYQNYEERLYPSIVWASASAEASSKSAVSRSIMKMLYAYLRGGNDRGEKLAMMVPVRTTKVANKGTNTYTMAVALLPEESENPPVPSDGNVTVTREPSTVYVVRSFGGKAREDDIWDSHARNLKDSVANDESLDTSFYYMSVYDSPWKETDRLNEVWMVKKE